MNLSIIPIELAANTVTVTREGLYDLAIIAVGASLRSCEKSLGEIQDWHQSPQNKISSAENLATSAENLQLALKFLNGFDSLIKGERENLVLRDKKDE